jgi:hypothetical protein
MGDTRIEYDDPWRLPRAIPEGKERRKCLPCRGQGFYPAGGDDSLGRTVARTCQICHGWGVRDLPRVAPEPEPDAETPEGDSDEGPRMTPQQREALRKAREPNQCRNCGDRIFFAYQGDRRHAYTAKPAADGRFLLSFSMLAMRLEVTAVDENTPAHRDRFRGHALDCSAPAG